MTQNLRKESENERVESAKKILYIDMDGVLVDFQSGIDALDPEVRAQHEDHIDEASGIFGLMRPMPGAVDAFHELAEIFDTYILSTAPWNNPGAWTDKRIWVERWLGEPAYKRLILSHHKNLNDGHFLVDDRTKRGADRFKGKLIHFGQSEYPNWERVLEYLRRNA